MELISIIIPTYNSEAFLDRALESIFAQTYTQWEVWIVDDASTDTTSSIIKKWQEKDSRVHALLLPTNSGGPAHPINEGVQKATGEYVAILEHDDWWHREKLEQQIAVFQKDTSNKVGFVTTDVEMIYSEFYKKTVYRMRRYEHKELLQKLFSGTFFFSFSIPLIRKDVFLSVGAIDEQFAIAGDQDFFIRLAEVTSFSHVPEPLVFYGVHATNLSSNQNKNNYIKQINDWLRLLNKYEEHFSFYKEAHAGKLGQIAFLYGLLGDKVNSRLYFKKAFVVQPYNIKNYTKYCLLLFFGVRARSVVSLFNRVRF
jgi:glycosyltransferase involved in cell wall biosynthesis